MGPVSTDLYGGQTQLALISAVRLAMRL